LSLAAVRGSLFTTKLRTKHCAENEYESVFEPALLAVESTALNLGQVIVA
jgi:hypothetical protein